VTIIGGYLDAVRCHLMQSCDFRTPEFGCKCWLVVEAIRFIVCTVIDAEVYSTAPIKRLFYASEYNRAVHY